MTTIRLGCGRAGTLFYEPGGLLLRSCLIPVGTSHQEHLLTFQLGYLGPGDITVHITLDGDTGPRTSPKHTTALLRGTDADDDDPYDTTHYRIPGVWLTYLTVPDTPIDYHYTVQGQPAPGTGNLRGQLTTHITGTLPLLTATTRETATTTPLPDHLTTQPVMDWDQNSGTTNATPTPSCPHPRPRPVHPAHHHRVAGPRRNIRT